MVDDKEEECGECDPCVYAEYDGEDPSTHCIKCTCIFCIPGA